MNYESIKTKPELISHIKSKGNVTLICDRCQTEYPKSKDYVQKNISKGYIKNYCSMKCRDVVDNTIYKKFNCTHCDTPNEKLFSQLTEGNNFCNRSCSAKHNNKLRTKQKTCLQCNKKYNSEAPKFCSTLCSQNSSRDKSLAAILNGTASSVVVKKYLLRTIGCICSICKNSEWNGKPIPIELEHIDGNSENNKIENCCLICPNCHAQTPTYKTKNIGNGRHKRRTRYQAGLSY